MGVFLTCILHSVVFYFTVILSIILASVNATGYVFQNTIVLCAVLVHEEYCKLMYAYNTSAYVCVCFVF